MKHARRKVITSAALSLLPLRAAPSDVRAAREILLGQSAIFSGPLSPPAQGFKEGALLAFSQINTAGGIGGRTIRLISADSGYTAEKAAEASKKLLSETGVHAFFGSTGTPTTAATVEVLKSAGIPLLGCAGTADFVRENADGTGYFLRASFGMEAEKIVRHLATIGIRRCAAASVGGRAGEDFSVALRRAIQTTPGAPELIADVMIASNGSDVGAAADAVIAARPQAVVLFLVGDLGIEFIKRLLSAGLHPTYFGTSILACDVVAKALDKRFQGISACQVVPYPWSNSDKTAHQFRQACAKTGVTISYYSYEGYLNALFAIEVFRRAGEDLSAARLHRTLRGFQGAIGGMDIDFRHGSSTGGHFVDLVYVRRDGAFIR